MATETIKVDGGIGVKDITILFTDLKGSTALYERIGDLKAFSLVHRHFDSLEQVINNHNGAIVKTIGDAVMATFLNPFLYAFGKISFWSHSLFSIPTIP